MKMREGLWAKIPFELLSDLAVTKIDLMVYGYIALRQGTNLNTWVSREDISESLKVAEVSVSRAITNLKRLGWLDVYRQGLGKTNVYQALIEALKPSEELKKEGGSIKNDTSRKPPFIVDNDPGGDENDTSRCIKNDTSSYIEETSYKETNKEKRLTAKAVAPVSHNFEVFKVAARAKLALLNPTAYTINPAGQNKAMLEICKTLYRLAPDRPEAAFEAVLYILGEKRRGSDKFWQSCPLTPLGIIGRLDQLWQAVIDRSKQEQQAKDFDVSDIKF